VFALDIFFAAALSIRINCIAFRRHDRLSGRPLPRSGKRRGGFSRTAKNSARTLAKIKWQFYAGGKEDKVGRGEGRREEEEEEEEEIEEAAVARLRRGNRKKRRQSI